MSQEIILIEEYCRWHHVSPDFVLELGQQGLLELQGEAEQQRIDSEALSRLDYFSRLHYDLDINMAGIEAIVNLMERVEQLQSRVRELEAIRQAFYPMLSDEEETIES